MFAPATSAVCLCPSLTYQPEIKTVANWPSSSHNIKSILLGQVYRGRHGGGRGGGGEEGGERARRGYPSNEPSKP